MAAKPFLYQDKIDDPYSSHAIILSRVGDGRNRQLLDVGSAQGVLAERLAKAGFEVTCIESNPTWAAIAAPKCHKMIVADLEQPISGLDGLYDVIMFGDVLEHLRDPSRVLRDLLGYLKPDGQVIVSVPNVAHLYVRLNLLMGRFEYMERGILDRTHLRFFTRRSFRRFLKENGLVVEEFRASAVPLFLVLPKHTQCGWLRMLHHINGLMSRVWSTMFGYQFVAVTRRGETVLNPAGKLC